MCNEFFAMCNEKVQWKNAMSNEKVQYAILLPIMDW